jgi:hypothetical protein
MKRYLLVLLAIAILLVGDTMLDPSIPPSVAAVLRDQERRLRNLENSPQLTNSSVKDGSTKYLDAAGNTVVVEGKIGSAYGIKITNSNGRVIYQATTDGTVLPTQALPMTISGNIRPGTTLATYDELWRSDFYSVGSKVDYDLTAYPNAGNMDFVIYLYERGTSPFTAFSVTGLTVNTVYSGTLTINPSALIPSTGTDPAGRYMTVRVQAKRNSGASTVDIALNGNFTNHG